MHVLRLLPGDDLRGGVQHYCEQHDIRAGFVATCAGSLTDWSLRFADQSSGATGRGHFEIVSLTGTLSVNGSHLHLAIADEQGRTIGGHLLAGCRVYTTAEIAIVEVADLEFTRAVDGSTPWAELQVHWR